MSHSQTTIKRQPRTASTQLGRWFSIALLLSYIGFLISLVGIAVTPLMVIPAITSLATAGLLLMYDDHLIGEQS